MEPTRKSFLKKKEKVSIECEAADMTECILNIIARSAEKNLETERFNAMLRRKGR